MVNLFRNLVCRIGFFLLEVFNRSRFWSTYKKMRALEKGPRTKILSKQKQNLSRLLRRACQQVPHYQKEFAQLSISHEAIDPQNTYDILAKLKPVSKDELRTGLADSFTSAGNRDRWQYSSTAGTTGDRLSIVRDFTKRDIIRATQMRTMGLLTGNPIGVSSVDIPPHACNVVCGLNEEGPQKLGPFIRWAIKERKVFKPQTLADFRGRLETQFLMDVCTLYPFTPAPWEKLVEQIDNRLDALLEKDPQFLRGLSIFLIWMAQRAKERDLKFPNLKTVLPYGSLVSRAMGKHICEGFGCGFKDVYGTSEVGYVACSCGIGEGMHIFEDIFKIEVMDDNDQVLGNREPGRLIITDLMNDAMPLIRYAIGDRGYIIDEPCPSGIESKRLVVLGREQETIRHDDFTVHPRDIHDVIFAVPEIMNYRLDEVARNVYTVAVVNIRGFDMPQLAKELQSLLKCKELPKIRSVPYITPADSGKFCNISLLSTKRELV